MSGGPFRSAPQWMADAVGSVSASAGGPTFVVCAYIPRHDLFKERSLSAGLEGDSASRSTAQELAATDIHTHSQMMAGQPRRLRIILCHPLLLSFFLSLFLLFSYNSYIFQRCWGSWLFGLHRPIHLEKRQVMGLDSGSLFYTYR